MTNGFGIKADAFDTLSLGVLSSLYIIEWTINLIVVTIWEVLTEVPSARLMTVQCGNGHGFGNVEQVAQF